MYDAWFPDWWSQLSETDQQLMMFMNRQRVEELHKKGANITATIEQVLATKYMFEPGKGGISIAAPPDMPPPTVAQKVHYFDDLDEKVIDVCHRYLGLLERLVAEFEQDHLQL